MNKQQCTYCVMDTTDPDIQFDSHGQCNHCTHFLNRLTDRIYKPGISDQVLHKTIRRIKKSGKNKEYDCILGISGGIDSCYAAYILKQLGVRTLLVHMDNGWNSEEAINNIKQVADKLGFDYQSYVLDWNEFRDLQLAFLKASVVEAETPTDIAILGALHQVAAEYRVKYIISGGNLATEGILPKMWHYNAKDTKYLYAINAQFGTQKLKSFPIFGVAQEVYYKLVKGIRMVYILNQVDFSKQAAMTLLEQQLNWKYYGGKHYESRFTAFIQSYYLPKKFNLDYRKATYSAQICAGSMTREQALQELVQPPYQPDKVKADMEYVSKKLQLSVEQLQQIIDLPPKTYRDYPHDEQWLQFLYRFYRKLLGKKSLFYWT